MSSVINFHHVGKVHQADQHLVMCWSIFYFILFDSVFQSAILQEMTRRDAENFFFHSTTFAGEEGGGSGQLCQRMKDFIKLGG